MLFTAFHCVLTAFPRPCTDLSTGLLAALSPGRRAHRRAKGASHRRAHRCAHRRAHRREHLAGLVAAELPRRRRAARSGKRRRMARAAGADTDSVAGPAGAASRGAGPRASGGRAATAQTAGSATIRPDAGRRREDAATGAAGETVILLARSLSIAIDTRAEG